jgi:1,4-dihydroxy-6-naphthoate synthase
VTAPLELGLGFSPCPNDTFMFHALVHGLVRVEGVRFAPELLDIEALNRRALDARGALPVTKLSVAAFARARDRYELLRAGAAIGRGCGPLVVRAPARTDLVDLADLRGARVATPGALTTAHALLRMFAPPDARLVDMRFDLIIGAVARGEVDAGAIIHESRFTFADAGLVMVADLGRRWEAATGLPLPLGVVAARRDLPARLRAEVGAAVARSVELAMAEPERSAAYVRAHARELSDDVCRRHIALYVNAFSRDLGEEGERAVAALAARLL